MKRFSFPLDRVMDWRRIQARVEEAKLAGLSAALRTVEIRQAELAELRFQSEGAALASRHSTGDQLAALDTFQLFTIAERKRLDAQCANCRKLIADQIQVMVAKRRDVRLIELLKERNLAAWQSEVSRELEAQAAQSYLAKWNAEKPRAIAEHE